MVRLATLVKNIAGASGNKTVSQLTTLVNSFPTKNLSNTSWRTVSESTSEISACNLELKSQMESLATAIRNKTGIDNTSANKLTREQMIYLLERYNETIGVKTTVQPEVGVHYFEEPQWPIKVVFATSTTKDGTPAVTQTFTFNDADFDNELEVVLNDYTFKIQMYYNTNSYNNIFHSWGPYEVANLVCEIEIPTNYTGYFKIYADPSTSFSMSASLKTNLYCSNGNITVEQDSSSDWGGITLNTSNSNYYGYEISDRGGTYGELSTPGIITEVTFQVWDGDNLLSETDDIVKLKLTLNGTTLTSTLNYPPYYTPSFTSCYAKPMGNSVEGTVGEITNLALPFTFSGMRNLLVLPRVYLQFSGTNYYTMGGSAGDRTEYACFSMSVMNEDGYRLWFDEYRPHGDIQIRGAVWKSTTAGSTPTLWKYNQVFLTIPD
jgi:hypothetical protein